VLNRTTRVRNGRILARCAGRGGPDNQAARQSANQPTSDQASQRAGPPITVGRI
jgi:hypothetical protein